MFNGRWSTQWALLQDRYLDRHFDPIPDKLSGTRWTTILIDTLWKSFRQLWDQRNGKVHGVDNSTRAKLQKEKAHRELIALYVLRDQTQHCDRDIYYDTAQDHLDAHNVGSLKNWLRVYQPLIKHSIKEAAWLAIHNMRTLPSYFRPAEIPD
jgi:hypothetical protein